MAAFTDIDDPSAHFNTITYTFATTPDDRVFTFDGNSDLKPDLFWQKRRDTTTSHIVQDSSRGVTKYMHPDQNAAELTYANYLKSFNTNGITIGGGDSATNQGNGGTGVIWAWKAGGGTTTSVSASGTGDLCINASTHQVNTDAGISIITYTGRDDQISNGQETKLTHGLGVTPKMMICKRRDGTSNWYVLGANATEVDHYWGWSYNEFLAFNSTAAVNGVNYTGNLRPDSTHIHLGNALVNTTDSWIAYVFAEKQGFSKFGKYLGNGNSDGPFVYTGFKPAFVMIKIIDTHGGTAGGWTIYDNKRGNNGNNYELFPHSSEAEYTGTSYFEADLLSTGFKIRLTNVQVNGNGKLYGYTAFAENPFVTSTGVPTTAR
jgi:hypothetical protein